MYVFIQCYEIGKLYHFLGDKWEEEDNLPAPGQANKREMKKTDEQSGVDECMYLCTLTMLRNR